MANNIFITATQRGCGKTTLALGLAALLERSFARVGYFKPIGEGNSHLPTSDVRVVRDSLGLDLRVAEMEPFTVDQVTEALSNGTYDEVVDEIIEAYQNIASKCDFVVIEGTDYMGAMQSFEFNVNADLAKNLGAPVLLVANAKDCEGGCLAGGLGCKDPRICGTMLKTVSLIKDNLDERNVELFGVVLNRARAEVLTELQTVSQEQLTIRGIRLLGLIPRTDLLDQPTVQEISDALRAKVVSGQEGMNAVAQDILVAGMGLEYILANVTRNSLVLVPGDRADVVVGLGSAWHSSTVPNPAGILLTNGIDPGQKSLQLFQDLTDGRMPLLKVAMDTYTAAVRIHDVKPRLSSRNKNRVEVVKALVERHINVESITSQAGARIATLTPKQFIHGLVDLARRDRKHIVLPEGTEERILQAADVLLTREIAEITLLGDEKAIREKIARLNLKLPDLKIVNPATSQWRRPFANRYVELRAPKRIVPFEAAFDIMADATYFGTMMVHEGLADGMVSGSINTTAHTLRPSLEFVKTRPGYAIASSVFFMCLPNQVLVYGDCAVNPNPTAEQLADIALASAETAAAFEIEPRVAMLSYSTGASGTGEDVDRVREATRIVRERRPDLLVEGPIQYDAAIDPDVAKTKLPGSLVAGRATVFIFPDLNTGNNTYKAVQRAAKAIAVGPVMQGLKKPVNDLSRGCTVPDIVNTVAITAIQAQRN